MVTVGIGGRVVTGVVNIGMGRVEGTPPLLIGLLFKGKDIWVFGIWTCGCIRIY